MVTTYLAVLSASLSENRMLTPALCVLTEMGCHMAGQVIADTLLSFIYVPLLVSCAVCHVFANDNIV